MSDNNKKPLAADEVLRKLDRDVLGMPEEFVDEALAKRGLDPDKVAAKGRALLRQGLREHKRSAWMKRAEIQRQKLARGIEHSAEWIRRRAEELLAAGHPEIQAAFRDRQPEDMDDEELRLLAEDQAIAEMLGEGEDVD